MLTWITNENSSFYTLDFTCPYDKNNKIIIKGIFKNIKNKLKEVISDKYDLSEQDFMDDNDNIYYNKIEIYKIN